MWLKLIGENVYPNVISADKHLVVVGNKADLEEQREIGHQEAVRFANEIGASYIETSAKSGFNMEKLLKHVLQYSK